MSPLAALPIRKSSGARGFDLAAFCLDREGRANTAIIGARSTKLIPTGLKIFPPDGYAIDIRSRSGLALDSIFVANAPGTIDLDYTGEIKILLYNGRHDSFFIAHGMRIAQLLLVPVEPIPDVHEIDADEIVETERGAKGFGSTGV